MPTINHAITVTINDVDRSSLLLKDSLYIKTSVGNKGDVASFVIRDEEDSFTPADWDEVIVKVNGISIFGGYVTSRSASGVGPGSSKVAHWNVECRDWSAILDTVVVQYTAVDWSDAEILSYLFDVYLQAEAFDLNTYVDIVDDDIDIAFEYVTMRKALDMLAEIAGAEWHIAPDKSLYWYSPLSPDDAAFNIDVVSPDNSTSFDVLAGSLRASVDSSMIVNRVQVFGGEELTEKITDNFIADGSASTFGPFTKKPGSAWKVTFTMGGVAHTNFADRIGYEPEDSLSIDGGDFNTLVNLENRHVKIQKTNGSVPDNGTTVSITYYALDPVIVAVESQHSQDYYGRTFEQTFYDEQLTSRLLAEAYGQRVLDEYAFGRETIQFSVTEHGLLPGRLITVNAPVLGVESTYNDALALETGDDVLLLEDGSRLMLESYGEPRKYLIQGVTMRTVVTGANTFMVIADVSAGKYVPTIIDSLAAVQGISGNVGRLPAKRTVGRLDHISNDLGEIVAGRAAFTDGGTAPFTWDAYNDHTGAVIGLEEDGSNAYGVVYILDDGEVMAKLGKLAGLPAVSGGTPTGWGLYTQNGYFSGVITASEMIGGTIATSPMPINSSNPGVYMTSAGLFGYGTLGLTFSIPSNPALAPYFSSGTINNVVYEVYESGVIRTSANPSANGGVQIDDSGIFAYATPANGSGLKFSVDANTGKMTAVGGAFSGTVSASQISGGTVTAAVFTGGSMTQGTVSAATINGGTVTGSQINGGTVTGGLVTGGTVTGSLVSGGTVSGALITAVGGSVTLDSANGLILQTQSTYNSADGRAIKWKTGSTIVTSLGATLNGGLNIETGVYGSNSGYFHTTVYSNGTDLSSYDQYPGYFNWKINLVDYLSLLSNYVMVYKNIVPVDTSANIQIGDTYHAFKYIYLRDDANVVRRVSINSSGVLTVT